MSLSQPKQKNDIQQLKSPTTNADGVHAASQWQKNQGAGGEGQTTGRQSKRLGATGGMYLSFCGTPSISWALWKLQSWAHQPSPQFSYKMESFRKQERVLCPVMGVMRGWGGLCPSTCHRFLLSPNSGSLNNFHIIIFSCHFRNLHDAVATSYDGGSWRSPCSFSLTWGKLL